MISLFDKRQDCCGCTACKSICPTQAITMCPDEEGFQYPNINPDKCIDCRKCKEVCAFQNGYDVIDSIEQPQVYAIKHTSDEIRKISSSGGAFTAISDYILLNSGIIYGAAFDASFRVIHRRAETKKDRDMFCGSKYVQSDVHDIFKQVHDDLKKARYVLFTGTPCQVSGLNQYLSKSNANTATLLNIDILCHGTPSPRIFADFVSFLEKKHKSKLAHYAFRSKAKGWGHTEEAVYTNGKNDHSSVLSQAHKTLFYSHMCLRPSCHECIYTNFKRPGDITIGDYWGIENYYPDFKDGLGVSALIISTDKGRNVYQNIINSIHSLPSNIHDCAERQKQMHNPPPISPKRDVFWNDYRKHGFAYVVKKYTKYGNRSFSSKLRAIIKKLNNIICRLYRRQR